MRAYAESTVFSTVPNSDGSPVVIEVASMSNPNVKYRVDLTNGRCSCPAWTRKRVRTPCKHLKALGYFDVQQDGYESLPKVAQPPKPAKQPYKPATGGDMEQM